MNRPYEDSLMSEARLEQAAEWFVRLHSESAHDEDCPGFKPWIEADPLNALAYQLVSTSWDGIGACASAPEVLVGRRDALNDARRAARSRWSVRRRRLPRYVGLAASLIIGVVGAILWVQNERGVYATEPGERSTMTLEDGSVVSLDANSRIHVRYQKNERTIVLERGQAHFDVAKDLTRPFRVHVSKQTVVALGTRFNLEMVAGDVLVAMIEGHVVVTGIEPAVAEASANQIGIASTDAGNQAPSGEPAKVSDRTVELKAGEGLRVQANGEAVVLLEIDPERATAWQSGKLFFDDEPLVSAVERVNRYSEMRIEVDPSVADVRVSGVFSAGDSGAFIEAVSNYFSVQVERMDSSIRLTGRN